MAGEGFYESVTSGDLRKGLEALRDFLAERLENAEPKSVAPIAKQLADVMKELDSLPGEEASQVDDLAERRAARRAAVPKRPPGGDVGGAGGG